MKHHFVLDENIIICAQTGCDDRDCADPTCLDLIMEANRNCHALVLTSRIWQRYSTQIRTLQQQGVPLEPVRVIAILVSMMANTEKDTRFLPEDDLKDVQGLVPVVKPDDHVFVRTAASVAGSILATTDGPLRIALASGHIDQDYGFLVHTPGEALEKARHV